MNKDVIKKIENDLNITFKKVNIDRIHLLSNNSQYSEDEKGNIVAINMSNLNVEDIIFHILKLKMLKIIYLNNNKIKYISILMKNFLFLKELYLNNNEIEEIQALTKIKNLEKVYLNNNKIEKIPSELFNLKNLKILKIDKNPIFSNEKLDFKTLKARIIQNNDSYISEDKNKEKEECAVKYPNYDFKENKNSQKEKNSAKYLNSDLKKSENHKKENYDLKSDYRSEDNSKDFYKDLNNVVILSQNYKINDLKIIYNLEKLYNINITKKEKDSLLFENCCIIEDSKVTELNIKVKYNKITSYLFNLKNLKRLIISGNFKTLPKAIGNLTKLEAINLDNNKLEDLPKEFYKLKKLERVSINNNNLLYMPPPLFQLKELKELYLNNNMIYKIPKDIIMLKKIEILSIKNNNLNYIDKNIASLNRLKKLHLAKNNIVKELRKYGSSFSKNDLISFLIENKKYPEVKDYFFYDLILIREIEYKIVDKIITNLDDLNKYEDLTSLDTESKVSIAIQNHKSITLLMLVKQHINRIFEEIINLKNLKILSLYGNNIKEIPENILDMENLKSLYLGNNRIEKIIALPENLTLLSLKNNNLNKNIELKIIPKNLTYLSLKGNNLDEIPDFVFELEKLEYLDLSYNNIKEIPNNISFLKSLNKLVISNNQITDLDNLNFLYNIKKIEKNFFIFTQLLNSNSIFVKLKDNPIIEKNEEKNNNKVENNKTESNEIKENLTYIKRDNYIDELVLEDGFIKINRFVKKLFKKIFHIKIDLD